MLEVKLLHPDAIPPTTAYGNPPDLCYDLYALEDTWVRPDPVLVRTGIACAAYNNVRGGKIPLGLIIKDRSSMALKGVYTHAGVIDPGYRGEILVGMSSTTRVYDHYLILKGAKFAQMMPVMCLTGPVTIVDAFPESDRGTGGFGSSGQ